jgi:flagellar biogenesis protein FliO
MDTPTSLLQAAAALLIVLGLIALTAFLYRRFVLGGAGMVTLGTKTPRRLQLVESLWLDARYRVVIVRDDNTTNPTTHTLLLGPQEALQLTSTARQPTLDKQ